MNRRFSSRTFFPNRVSGALAGMVAAAAILSMGAAPLAAQNSAPAAIPGQGTTPPVTTQTTDTPVRTTTTTTGTTPDQNGIPQQTVTSTTTFHGRGKKKDDKVVQSKDTKKSLKKEQKLDALAGVDVKLPDKQLYDKAMDAIKRGRYDVARLDLQSMLSTYPDSQYQMRAKLAVADSWYKEGGTAALLQAESEYADFRVFFPNAPEAAEAQMRIGDIYFRQMDRPDRDYAKAVHAEEEYRRMMTDYPDSTLVPQAKQRLRDVQEVLATREADIANFYASRENWAAVIARYQTVVDTYPLYSHMDDVLVGLGDAYEAQARYIRGLKLAEGPKAKLEALYDGEAADAYRKVVLEHSAAPHVEDARDRLDAMGLPIPTPTKEQVANSEALENSRNSYKLSDRAILMFMHKPDTVTAARIGEPPLTDAKQTVAPEVTKRVMADFNAAFAGNAPAAPGGSRTAEISPAPSTAAGGTAPAAATTPVAPLQLNSIPASDAPGGGSTVDMTPAATSGGGATRTGMSVEILNPSPRGTAADTTNGLTAVGPKNSAPLPPVEKAAPAPDVPNEITSATPAAQAPRADGKKTKAEYDKADESSSKHKKKKGIKKIVPPL